MPRTFKATIVLIVTIGLLLLMSILTVVQNHQMTQSVTDVANGLEEVNRTMTEISDQLAAVEEQAQEAAAAADQAQPADEGDVADDEEDTDDEEAGAEDADDSDDDDSEQDADDSDDE